MRRSPLAAAAVLALVGAADAPSVRIGVGSRNLNNPPFPIDARSDAGAVDVYGGIDPTSVLHASQSYSPTPRSRPFTG